jgi:hypothetical protein
MKPRGWWDFALYASMWVMLLAGIFTEDWWKFAPAAFFIHLEHMAWRR